jgi:beta,beta-carotene 9',10'-dioxygenase
MILRTIKYAFIAVVCASCASQEDAQRGTPAFHDTPLSPLYYYQNLEEVKDVPLTVQGRVPTWLEGEFVRNGPAIIKGKTQSVRSWFDGLGKLHGFTFENGEIRYTCQLLKSTAYRNFETTGELDFAGFAQQPTQDSFSYIDFMFDVPNPDITNANVNVSKINDQMIALTETPLPVAFDKDLNTLGSFNYADSLPKNYSFESAHILKDPDSKAMWNFLINIGLFETAYQIYKIPPGSTERQLISSIPVSAISYMHSFAIAGKYFVLVDYPLRARDPLQLVHEFIESFAWFPDEPTKIHIINRETGVYQSLTMKPFFSFHHINGYEVGGTLIVDLIAYPTPDIISKVNKFPFVPNPDNAIWRLEMDLTKGTVHTRQISSEHMEFPRINESYIGKEYQYFYAVHIRPSGNGLIKYNHKGKSQHWSKPGLYANEPVFIPHPQGRDEDEGVILSVVNDLNKKTSFLLILNGKDFKELARIHAPHFIPFGFHGQFFPKNERQK